MVPFLILLALAPGPSPRQDAASTTAVDDLERLQGRWEGMAGPFDDLPVILVIEGDCFTRTVETAPQLSFTTRGRLRLDDAAVPKRLDWIETTGPDGQPVPDAPAVYRFDDGGELTICSAGPGGDRPSEFVATGDRYPTLRTYARPAPVEPVEGDLAILQGTWTGAVGNGGATAILQVRGRSARFVLQNAEGRQLLATDGRVELDESATPKAMDWVPDEDRGPRVLSIYEFDGEALRICIALGRGDVPRPDAFSEDFRTILLTREAREGSAEKPQDDSDEQP